mgnify:CR=1 FL=1
MLIFRCLIVLLLLSQSVAFAATFEIGGQRPAKLIAPERSGKLPLVVMLHGYTSNSTWASQYFKIQNLQDSMGFALVLPEGTINSEDKPFWNATPECCDFEETGVDDVGYLKSLIDESKNLVNIDSDKVFFMGHSNGGFMSYRMACEHPELIKGIISISGASFRDTELCKGSGAVNILQIHGTADEVIPYEENERFASPMQSVLHFVNKGSCNEPIVQSLALDLVSNIDLDGDGSDTDLTTWKSCSKGERVGLWSIQTADHAPQVNDNWLRAALSFVGYFE